MLIQSNGMDDMTFIRHNTPYHVVKEWLVRIPSFPEVRSDLLESWKKEGFVLTVPRLQQIAGLVVVLLLVLLQVAFLGIDRIVVLGAAREAAREAAVTGDRGRIEAAARRLVTNGDDVDVVVTTDAADGRRAYGAAVTATVRVTTRPRVPGASGVFPERVTLQSSVTTRIEQQ